MALPRIAYTQYKRHHDNGALPLACNAFFPDNVSAASSIYSMDKADQTEVDNTSRKNIEYDEKHQYTFDAQEIEQAKDSAALYEPLKIPVAVFPQYVSEKSTNIVIQESSLPHLPDSFAVIKPATGERLFDVVRERPSFSRRQHLVDARTSERIMTIRRDVGTLPRSYVFEDLNNTKVLELQGNFSLPTQGLNATALFTNAATATIDDRAIDEVTLHMHSSWRNRHITITNKQTGETVATVESEILNIRNVVGGRRTYMVVVKAGVDIALITSMVVAADARRD